MSNPTHFDTDPDLAAELAELRRQFNRLSRRVNRREDATADYTISEWCQKHGVSHAGYYKLRKEGRGPDTIINKGVVRISVAADLAWEQRWSSGTTAASAETATAGLSNDKGAAA